jgi:hypothetical protein
MQERAGAARASLGIDMWGCQQQARAWSNLLCVGLGPQPVLAGSGHAASPAAHTLPPRRPHLRLPVAAAGAGDIIHFQFNVTSAKKK